MLKYYSNIKNNFIISYKINIIILIINLYQKKKFNGNNNN